MGDGDGLQGALIYPIGVREEVLSGRGCVISVSGERGRGLGGTWVWVLLRSLLGWWRVGDAGRCGCGDNGRWRLVLGLHRHYIDSAKTVRGRATRYVHGMLMCFIHVHRVLGGIDLLRST